MFNCKKMREADFCNKALKSLNGNPLMKSCSEEGILNYMLDEDKIALPLKFNYLEPWWNNWINYKGDKLTEYNEVKKNPTIIHYTGFKPNHIHSLHSLREKWWYYAQKTPCYKEILENFKKDANAYVDKMQNEIGKYKKILNEIKEKTAPFA